jgi:hypothetical protein
MSSLSRRACYKCGNVGHYAGMLECAGGKDPNTDILSQRSAPRPSVSATTVCCSKMLDMLNTGTNARLQASSRVLKRFTTCQLRSERLTPNPGHESNGCPHPRTTESMPRCHHISISSR